MVFPRTQNDRRDKIKYVIWKKGQYSSTCTRVKIIAVTKKQMSRVTIGCNLVRSSGEWETLSPYQFEICSPD